MMINRL